MTRTVRLRVYGTPAPQGSKTAVMVGGHARVIEGRASSGRQAHKSWRDAVATTAADWQAEHDAPLLEGPVRLEAVFILHRPKSVTRKRRPYPTTRPDLDKLLRSTLDSLTGRILGDDSQIVSIDALKVYDDVAPPGALLRLTEVPALVTSALMDRTAS